MTLDLLKRARAHLPLAAAHWNLDEDQKVADFHVQAVLGLIKEIDSALSTPAAPAADAEPTAYCIGDINVERVQQLSGAHKRAARRHGNVLNKLGEWEREPSPSGRDDEFLARCRYDTAHEAITAARQAGKGGSA